MSFTHNIVILLGRAGKDAEVKTVGQKSTKIAKFSMVTGTDKTTCWHNVQAWDKLADAASTVKKGDQIAVHGSIVNSKVGDKYYSCINANLIINYGKKAQAEHTDEQDGYVPTHGTEDIPF
jgi:Tfp pilus assembly protein PilX